MTALARIGLTREAIARLTGARVEPVRAAKTEKPRPKQSRHDHPPAWFRSWVYHRAVGERFTAQQITEERGVRLYHVQWYLAQFIQRGEVAKRSGTRGPAAYVWRRNAVKATWGWQRPHRIMASIGNDKPGTPYEWQAKPVAEQGAWKAAINKARAKGWIEQAEARPRTVTVYWRIQP